MHAIVSQLRIWLSFLLSETLFKRWEARIRGKRSLLEVAQLIEGPVCGRGLAGELHIVLASELCLLTCPVFPEDLRTTKASKQALSGSSKGSLNRPGSELCPQNAWACLAPCLVRISSRIGV